MCSLNATVTQLARRRIDGPALPSARSAHAVPTRASRRHVTPPRRASSEVHGWARSMTMQHRVRRRISSSTSQPNQSTTPPMQPVARSRLVPTNPHRLPEQQMEDVRSGTSERAPWRGRPRTRPSRLNRNPRHPFRGKPTSETIRKRCSGPSPARGEDSTAPCSSTLRAWGTSHAWPVARSATCARRAMIGARDPCQATGDRGKRASRTNSHALPRLRPGFDAVLTTAPQHEPCTEPS